MNSLVLETRTIRPRKTFLYFILGLIPLLLLIAHDRPDLADMKLYFSIGALVLFGLLFYALSKTGIVIDKTGITQQHAFGRKKVLLWVEINGSKLEWEAHPNGFYPLLMIQGMSKDMQIHISQYSRRDIKLLTSALVSKTPKAHHAQKVRHMAEGKFPWYIF